jgi:low temperature requirement protein LtrA
MAYRLKRTSFTLSSSMVERMGLFTIIMFGEVVTGVINGANGLQALTWINWGNFVLAILIIFALWWIFFALIADRECKEGFLKGQLMIIVYIPVLMSLGMLGSAFPGVFRASQSNITADSLWMYELFAFRIATFLLGIALISGFLVYPTAYAPAKKWLRVLLIISGIMIPAITLIFKGLSLFSFFIAIFILLLLIIITITKAWLKFEPELPK